MIEIEGLRFRDLEIERLSISKGLTFIRGENGSGKTTLLQLVAGLYLPNEGTISIDGKTSREIHAGYVSEFPSRNMIFANVFEEIASPLRFAGYAEEDIYKEVESVAEIFGIPHLLSREYQTLSGGEKVLTATATAAVGNPTAVLLDEPDSHLDEQTAQEIASALLKMEIPYILWASHRSFFDGFEVRL